MPAKPKKNPLVRSDNFSKHLVLSHLQGFPEFVPLPSGKETEYYSGLKRGALNQLILPCSANGHRPLVMSVSMRRPGNLKGKRLVVLASLLSYLRRLQTEQSNNKKSL